MATVQRFSRNEKGRDFVVGDIHGAFDLVLEAMKLANFNPDTDRLFSVGDLIDRGPGSHRCAKFLNQPYVHAVRGNHEDMLLDLYAEGPPDPTVLSVASRYNGFAWWMDLPENQRQEILEAVSRLPMAIEVDTGRGKVGLIHADVPAGMAWDEFIDRLEADDPDVTQTCLWGRDRIRTSDLRGVAGIARVFVGHTPQWDGMTRFANVYALDTGAAFGLLKIKEEGCLTMTQMVARTGVLDASRRMPGLIDLRDDVVGTDARFGQYAVTNRGE